MSQTAKTLYVTLSSHGFGHIAQTSPILNELMRSHGHVLNIVLQSTTPLPILKTFFNFPFKHVDFAGDVGMEMASALEVLPQQTHRAYLDFHEYWPQKIMQQVRLLERHQADMVFSNVSYLSLAAAQDLSMPNMALCSLHWGDIYQHYCGHMAQSEDIYNTAMEHYQQADKFLIPTPAMPMQNLRNGYDIGPIARVVKPDHEFKKKLSLPPQNKVVLVSMGGFSVDSSREQWPKIPGVTWIDCGNQNTKRYDILPLSHVPVSLIDCVRNCDLVVCKPGYGLFTESTCNETPILYVTREGWPEAPPLINWLRENNNTAELPRADYESGEFADAVLGMLDMSQHNPYPYMVKPYGVALACEHIVSALWPTARTKTRGKTASKIPLLDGA